MTGDADRPEPGRYTTEHFSLTNPYGPGMDDVPRLLRRVADEVAGLGDAIVVDLILHTDVTGEGYWPSVTVYFSRDDADVEASRWRPHPDD